MPIYFFWSGLLYKAIATPQTSHGQSTWLITFNGRERRLMNNGYGWSELVKKDDVPLVPELKNRIGHAILFYNKLK